MKQISYNQFERIINNTDVVDENVYNDLIDFFTKESIDRYFEIFIDKINESDIKNLNKVEYYLDQKRKEEIKLSKNMCIDDGNILGTYIGEISSIPLLSEKEEKIIATIIKESSEFIKNCKYADEDIKEELDRLEYSKKYNTNIKELKNQLLFLETYGVSTDRKIKDIEDLLKAKIKYYTNREIMINANLRLVVSVAKRYVDKDVEFLDLIQEGNNGLITAIDKFDVTKGYKFSTYAIWWLRQSIGRNVIYRNSNVRIPVHAVEFYRYIDRNINEKESQISRKLTVSEKKDIVRQYIILKSANGKKRTKSEIDELTERKYEQYCKTKNYFNIESLQTPVGEKEISCIGDFVSDDSYDKMLENSFNNELTGIYKELLSILSTRQCIVLLLRHGFDLKKYVTYQDFCLCVKQEPNEVLKEMYYKPEVHTLEEVGNLFGLTRERIRQIQDKALNRLSKYKARFEGYISIDEIEPKEKTKKLTKKL